MTESERTLSPDAPVDQALRWLARQSERRASAQPAEGEQDLRPIYRFGGWLCTLLAKWSRDLPGPLREATARHLATGLVVVSQNGNMEQEPRERAAHRTAYGVLLAMLLAEGVPIEHEMPLSIALWGSFQLHAQLAAQHVQPPAIARPGVDPAQEVRTQMGILMTIREHLIQDWLEMSWMWAGMADVAKDASPAGDPDPAGEG